MADVLRAVLDRVKGIAPPPMPRPPYSPLDTSTPAVISQARDQYPFMAGQVLVPTSKQGGEGWPVGETGDTRKEKSDPMALGRPPYHWNQPGAEIGPGSTPADVAGEALHSDVFANGVRDRLGQSFNPTQREYLMKASLDAQGASPGMALQNGTDSAIRGVVAHQWPQSAISGMKYTPSQLDMINGLDKYMRTGIKAPR